MVLASSYGVLEGPVTAAIRPEDIDFQTGKAEGGLVGAVTAVRAKPTYTEIEIDAGLPLVAHDRRAAGEGALSVGDPVTLRIRPEAVKLFPRTAGA